MSLERPSLADRNLDKMSKFEREMLAWCSLVHAEKLLVEDHNGSLGLFGMMDTLWILTEARASILGEREPDWSSIRTSKWSTDWNDNT